MAIVCGIQDGHGKHAWWGRCFSCGISWLSSIAIRQCIFCDGTLTKS